MNPYRINILLIPLLFMFGICVGSGSVPGLKVHTRVFPVFLKRQLAACESIPAPNGYYLSDKERCYTKTLVNLVKQHGMPIAVATLRVYLASPTGAFLSGQRCHALAHEIGNAAVRTGISPHQLLSECSQMCLPPSAVSSVDGLDLGCMNGAAHTWVLLTQNVQTVSGYCSDPRVPQAVGEGCFHGIGHGLSEEYAGDIGREIDECKKIPEKEGRYQCAHAVFMEKQALLTKNSLPDDALVYCRSLLPEMADSCYEFAGYLTYAKTENVNLSFAVCAGVPEEKRPECVVRLGESFYKAKQRVGDVHLCTGQGDVIEKKCLQGFLRGSIDTVNDIYGHDAFAICLDVPAHVRTTCMGQVGNMLYLRYGESLRRTSCMELTGKEDQEACISGEGSI